MRASERASAWAERFSASSLALLFLLFLRVDDYDDDDDEKRESAAGCTCVRLSGSYDERRGRHLHTHIYSGAALIYSGARLKEKNTRNFASEREEAAAAEVEEE